MAARERDFEAMTVTELKTYLRARCKILERDRQEEGFGGEMHGV